MARVGLRVACHSVFPTLNQPLLIPIPEIYFFLGEVGEVEEKDCTRLIASLVC